MGCCESRVPETYATVCHLKRGCDSYCRVCDHFHDVKTGLCGELGRVVSITDEPKLVEVDNVVMESGYVDKPVPTWVRHETEPLLPRTRTVKDRVEVPAEKHEWHTENGVLCPRVTPSTEWRDVERTVTDPPGPSTPTYTPGPPSTERKFELKFVRRGTKLELQTIRHIAFVPIGQRCACTLKLDSAGCGRDRWYPKNLKMSK